MKQSFSTPTITAFKSSPDRGRGLARDMRVRWAFEEVGQAYNVRLVTFDEMKQPTYRALQPFGQIPAYQEGDLVLFESGAIILHLAEKHAGLLPTEAKARARAITWMFAALNTVEPPIVERSACWLFERDKSWYKERLPLLDDNVRVRLNELSARFGDADWLDGEFSAGDLLMVTVLRRLTSSGLLEHYPKLSAYIARAEARPAYQRAFAAQLAVFNEANGVEALKEVFAAINRNDLPAALQFFDPEIVRIEPEGFPSAGTYRGHAEVLAHLSKGRGTWAEGACEPERFLVAGDKIVVCLHVRVRLKNKVEWIDGRFADVFTFRNGKVIEMRTFGETQQAFDWAGVRE